VNKKLDPPIKMQAARLPSMAQQPRRSHPQAAHVPAAARRWPLPAVTVAPPPAAAAAIAAAAPAPRRAQHHQQHPQRMVAARAEAAGSTNSGDSDKKGGLLTRLFARFDRLPAQTQMVVLTVLGFTAFSVVPFLQPTFLYGNNSAPENNIATVVPVTTGKTSKRAQRAAEKAAEKARLAAAQAQAEADAAEEAKYQRMREIPVAGPVLGYLQDCAMPKKLPDGRTESPGFVRIYFASLILLAVFYAASAVLQGLINLFVAVLVKVGILHVRRPPTPPPGASAAA
jgi:hypothetical protein